MPIPFCEVHVGDNATLFTGKLQADGKPYDPTDALIKRLIFKTQSGLFIRDDVEVTVAADAFGTTWWYLQYLMRPGTADDRFHLRLGLHQWQGYIEFSSGQRFWTSISTYMVEANLS